MRLKRTITVDNKLGLHVRAAAQLIKLCSGFSSNIQLRKDEKVVDAKSILGVMMLAATQGTILELLVEGEDAETAAQAIVSLFADYFGEEE